MEEPWVRNFRLSLDWWAVIAAVIAAGIVKSGIVAVPW